MKRLIPLFLLLCGCATSPVQIAPFSTDGCSLFPDGDLKEKNRWCSCCVEHDIAYWQGGTEQQKQHADQRLKECVLHKTGDKILAEIVFKGVELGGHPVFPNWYRWGYGWPYGRGFRPLNDSEQSQVQDQLQKTQPIQFCEG